MPIRPNANELAERTVGSPKYLGTITTTDTAAKNNANTAVPFTLTSGSLLLLQPDTDCALAAAEASGTAVTAATGVTVYAGERYPLTLHPKETFLSVIRLGANVNVKVFELR